MSFAELSRDDRRKELTDAIDLWIVKKGEDPAPPKPLEVFLHWRGRPKGGDSSGPAGIVTIVEFARLAFLTDDEEELRFVKEQAERFLKIDANDLRPLWDYSSHQHSVAKAISHVVLAVVNRRDNEISAACKALRSAGRIYEHFWKSDDSTPVESGSGLLPIKSTDKFEDDVVRLLLDAFADPKGFRPGATTWMILHEWISYILGQNLEGFRLAMKGLFVHPDPKDREHRVGQVLEVVARRFEKAPVATFYLDPLSLGVTYVQPSMRQSMRAAWRCCRFVDTEPQVATGTDDLVSIRVDFDFGNSGVSAIGGGSAGGLIAAMMCAAHRQLELPSDVSATCTLCLPQPGSGDAPTPDPSEVKLGPIKGTIEKVKGAWENTGISEVLLHPTNWREWELAGRPGPAARKVETLQELIEGLDRYRRHWEVIGRVASQGEGRWEQIIGNQTAGRVDRDHHHRLDLYVPQRLRVEGPPKVSIERPGEGEKAEPQTLAVLGGSLTDKALQDEPLLRILSLSLGGQTEVNPAWFGETGQVPRWLLPGRDLLVYDQAGAGKSVLTLRIAHLLNQPEHRRRLFGSNRPSLVIRVEGEWEKEPSGAYVELREQIYRHLVRQREQPDVGEGDDLDQKKKDELRDAVAVAIVQKRVVLIVDGFDQLPEAGRKHLVKLHGTADGRCCRWVIASRQHTIGSLFVSADAVSAWMRVRIEAFDSAQRDCYFAKAELGESWKSYVNAESMSELLELPWVLDRLRGFIEERQALAAELAAKSPGKSKADKIEAVEFESVSQLALVTSRLSLDRALDPEKLGGLEAPAHLKVRGDQLEAVEHVLSLVAFELLLGAKDGNDDRWNGRLLGREKKEQFLASCRDRFHRPIDLAIQAHESKPKSDLGDHRRKKELERQSDQAAATWDWCMEVLKKTELHHRAYVEQNQEDIIAFRDRKSMEFYTSRYLMRYATAWDVEGDAQAGGDPTVACVWQHIADKQWSNTWNLAIEMPQAPLPGTTGSVYLGSVSDPYATCQSLSVLYRRTLDGQRRPTELMWKAWPLFESDHQRSLDCRFRDGFRMVKGSELAKKGRVDDLSRYAADYVLSDRESGSRRVRELRERVLSEFRSMSRKLVDRIESRLDTVLLADGSRSSIPCDPKERAEVLRQWQTQSHEEKSLTFLQSPPRSWIKAHEVGDAKVDPRVNAAIQGHEAEAIGPILMQSTAVTRGMYALFDPQFDRTEHIAVSMKEFPWSEFPVVAVTWYDAFMYAKFLGREYRLPTEFEWEHSARGGTTSDYHFGDRLSGDLANCNGTMPWPKKAKHPKEIWLGGCTPAGLSRYPCNAYGLFDVHGNVWEWCADRCRTNAAGRVFRGGSWINSARYCRAASRPGPWPDFRAWNQGFRVCLLAPGPVPGQTDSDGAKRSS
jgi:hypothetical protein